MLKSTTALAGAALGSGLITGFPAIHASGTPTIRYLGCLLYTSDAADD